jgi:hypothetical protein
MALTLTGDERTELEARVRSRTIRSEAARGTRMNHNSVARARGNARVCNPTASNATWHRTTRISRRKPPTSLACISIPTACSRFRRGQEDPHSGARSAGPGLAAVARSRGTSRNTGQNAVALVVRAEVDLAAILPAIRAAMREVDPAQPIQDVRRLDQWIAGRGSNVGCEAGAAWKHDMGRRRHRPGLAGAWTVSRAIASLPFDISARDPLTFVAAGAGLSAVALLACAVSAVRATRIEPIVALRSD